MSQDLIVMKEISQRFANFSAIYNLFSDLLQQKILMAFFIFETMFFFSCFFLKDFSFWAIQKNLAT